MLTLTLQCLSAVLGLAFGLLALRVARTGGTSLPTVRRQGWWVTGASFTALGTTLVLGNIWAVWAFAAGPGSAAWNGFLAWTPAWTYSRVAIVVLLALALLRLAFVDGQGERSLRIRYAALLGLGMVAGGAAGRMQGPLVGNGGAYFSTFALSNAAEAGLLLLALASGLVRGTVGRHLWLALCVYALVLVLNVNWFSAMAWADVPGAWRPKPYMIQGYSAAAFLLMIGVAGRRLARARRASRLAPR
jgi:hypothetical protein